jgi:hypothetical protein
MELDVPSRSTRSARRVAANRGSTATAFAGSRTADTTELKRGYFIGLDVQELLPNLGHRGIIEDGREPFQMK